METTILIILGVIAILVAYIVGRFHEVPSYPYSYLYYWGDYPHYCRCPQCYTGDYVNRTTAKINEENIYQRGVFDGKVEMERYYHYKPRTMSEGEIVEKLKTAIKPLEELKKELGIEQKLN